MAVDVGGGGGFTLTEDSIRNWLKSQGVPEETADAMAKGQGWRNLPPDEAREWVQGAAKAHGKPAEPKPAPGGSTSGGGGAEKPNKDKDFLRGFLENAGHDPGTTDVELVVALQAWQKQRGLKPTGDYDDATRAHIKGILSALDPNKPAGSPPAAGAAPQEGGTPDPTLGQSPPPATTPVEPENLSDQEVADQIRRDYPHLAFLLNNTEIGPILTKAVREGWDPAETQAKIVNTTWWRSHGDAARQWITELETDPATAQRRLAVELGRLDRTLSQLGLTLDNQTKWDIADSVIRFGLSEEEVNSIVYGKLRESLSPQPIVAYGQSKAGDDQALAAGADAVKARVKRIFLNRGVRMQSHTETAEQRLNKITDDLVNGRRTFDDIRRSVDYQSGALTGGTAKGVSNRLHAIASEYLVPMTERDLDEWAIRLLEGTASEDGFRAELQNRATSRFPWLKGQLDAGETVASIFGSHKAALAQTLEMAPEQVDLFNNPKFSHITDFVDDKGQRRSMTLAEVTQWARNQPEYQKTRQANTQSADLVETLLQTFGKVA